jgi:ribosomal 50S subunit-associated protein YjgA (DUF615 family)
MSDYEEEYQSRSSIRRAGRAILDERKETLELFIKLPDDKIGHLEEVDRDVEESLMLLRRLKASGARARVAKNLSRRASDADWLAINALVHGSVKQTAARAAHDQRLVDWRTELLTSDVAVNALRSDFPNADHQRIRQLVLQGRRNPESGTAKGARKKLMRTLRTLELSDDPEISEDDDSTIV